MSTVGYAVRIDGKQYKCPHSLAASVVAERHGGKVVRITRYPATETKARRAVIEAARALAGDDTDAAYRKMQSSVDGLQCFGCNAADSSKELADLVADRDEWKRRALAAETHGHVAEAYILDLKERLSVYESCSVLPLQIPDCECVSCHSQRALKVRL